MVRKREELWGGSGKQSASELKFTTTNKLYTKNYGFLLNDQLASCLIYAQELLEYVIFIMWLRYVIKILPSVEFAEDMVLTFLIFCEKC